MFCYLAAYAVLSMCRGTMVMRTGCHLACNDCEGPGGRVVVGVEVSGREMGSICLFVYAGADQIPIYL